MADKARPPLYKGSCHCGYTVYTARIDLKNPTCGTGESIPIATRCNCSICVKAGTLLADPFADTFTLLAPVNPDTKLGDRSLLSNYTFAPHICQHRFCPKCGIRCFIDGEVDLPDGSKQPLMRINLQTLDGRVKEGTDEADDSALEPLEDLKDARFGYWNLKYQLDTPGLKPGSEPAAGGFW